MKAFTGYRYFQMGWSAFTINAPSREAADLYCQSQLGWQPYPCGYVTGCEITKEYDQPMTYDRVLTVDAKGKVEVQP